MSTISLKSLSIENLRGSVTPFVLNFEKGKKLTIIMEKMVRANPQFQMLLIYWGIAKLVLWKIGALDLLQKHIGRLLGNLIQMSKFH